MKLYLFLFVIFYQTIFCFNSGQNLCYQYQVPCGLNSHKNVPRLNISVTYGNFEIKCFSSCKSTPNCTGINLCRTNQESFCEIVFDDGNPNVCENVDNTKAGCTFYNLVESKQDNIPTLEIPDDARSPYLKILQIDAMGSVIMGTKSALKTKVYDGGHIQAVVKNWNAGGRLLVHFDSVKSISDDICLASNWNTISLSGEHIARTIIMVCSTGYIHRQDWIFGQNNKVNDQTFMSAVDWFVRHISPGNNMYTKTSSGYPEEIVKAVQYGREMMINLGTYENSIVFAKNTLVQNSVVYSFDVWDISISQQSGIVKFQGSAYWFSKLIRSNTFIHIGRWYLESSTVKSFSTKTSFSPKYYVDIYWKSVLKTNQSGLIVNGSMHDLTYFVKHGHRLRVYVNNQALEGLSATVTNTGITVMTFGSLKLAAEALDTTLTHTIGQISTNGSTQFFEVPIGSDNVGLIETNNFKTEWFIDLRQWNLTYSTEQFNKDESSMVPTFQNIYDSGAKIRLNWIKESTEELFTIDTLSNLGDVYQAFAVKNVYISGSKVYYNFYGFYPNGTVEMRRVTFGTGQTESYEVLNQQTFKWFCNY